MFANEMHCHHGGFSIALRYGVCVPLHELPDGALSNDGVLRVSEGMVHQVPGGITFDFGESPGIFLMYDEILSIRDENGELLWKNLRLPQVFAQLCYARMVDVRSHVMFYQQTVDFYERVLDELSELSWWQLIKRLRRYFHRIGMRVASSGLKFYKAALISWDEAYKALVQGSLYPLLDLLDQEIASVLHRELGKNALYDGEFPLVPLRYDLAALAAETQTAKYKAAKEQLLLEFRAMDDRDEKTIFICGTTYSVNDLITAVQADTRVGREYVAMVLYVQED